MPEHLTFYTSMLFVVAVTSIMITVILWWYPNVAEGQKKTKRILSLAFLALFLWHTFQFFGLSDQHTHLYHISKTGMLVSMSLFLPLNYLYFHTLAYSNFNRSVIVHLILPVTVGIISIYHSGNRSDAFSDLALLLIHFQITAYWIMEVNLILKLMAVSKKGFIHINTHWLKWTVSYLALQVLLFLPYFLITLGGIQVPAYLHPSIIEVCSGFLLCLSLFFQPFLLFGIRDIKARDFSDRLHQNLVAKSLEGSKQPLSYEEEKIEKYVSRHRPYLNNGITVDKLALEIGISSSSLRAYLRSKNLKFDEYLNIKRILYSQNIIKEKAYHDMTMDMLAKQSGFMDRNSFIASFKKHTGYNPSDYIKHFF
ncbi:hypothetical protein DN752_19315 [Echinicola strongylocentroti]|uniref:HTH araC/xylS-type domain-containing protein n=1 Tax=Echinicola strongylocentroti TaxID=1795355 RepID=A0A2Z4IP45_9BACT|nr:AraC family transcriptional regulator [Echinicola strongylocentroti]AWW32113.1 hypothetical protein DN752_19315 [Echinicola strongylocentroti]